MRRLALFVVGVGVLVGTVVMQPSGARAQENKNTGLRLSVVGIAVKDYPKSQNFYEKVMGFPVAFTFSSADGKRTTTYYQMSRDTFLEMQSATADVPPGLTPHRDRRPERHHRSASAGRLASRGAYRDDSQHPDRAWRRSTEQREERKRFRS
jgi:catechol 2,3-dioxygenase-like lactoylglutathione lyase family enzyme